MAARKLIAGNWKMNGMRAAAAVFADAVIAGAAQARADLLVCPPTTLIADLAQRFAGTDVAVGGQDCHAEPKGAHTGDVAAVQLQDAGASYVILGHSERRADHAESNDEVKAKATAAISIGLIPIICVGETAAERAAGRTLAVVEAQLLGSLPDGATADTAVIAYEPVWAIGSGAIPTLAEIAEVHGRLRVLADQRGAPGIRLLYGGSVKPSNAAEILAVADVDGALVGGASLLAADFLAIAAAA